MAKDPVCGMECDEKTAVKSEHMGQTYYFCSQGCKTTFDADPQKYAGGGEGDMAGYGGHQM